MIIPFLISLIIIIITHETAHLIIAKRCGCGVIKYNIGFGKPILFSKKIGNTIYQLTPWLFGGYCQLKGELKSTRAKNAFINLPYRKKLSIAIAGCAINIITGGLAMILGIILQIYHLYYFGYIALILGVTNLLPIAPCLDGGYIVYFPLFIKLFGKKKGLIIFAKSVKISFLIIMILNVLCIPLLISLIMKGAL